MKFIYATTCLAIANIAAGVPTANSALEQRDENAPQVTGDLTAYYQNGGTGSCGQKHGDNDFIVALSSKYMKQFKSPNCGRHLTARNPKTGKTARVMVADTCDGCKGDDVDFSIGAWNAITNNAALSRTRVTWDWS
ncbi:hypothetical protein FQN57_000184 [Myotisia sp. PD_48]|nr:hypothetical protein FQN57_000184 [Myotisia sp. PD_48]